MARYAYERLSAQDASFLWAEHPNNSLHIGAVAVLEAAPIRRSDGSIDIDLYRRQVESVLHWIPRYRQKIEWTPIESWPVWVDDRQFDLGYHIRHIALPRPGTSDQLMELVARINSRPLDRRRPLWEIWVIEGIEDGDQFAVLNKIHHCMIDGAAGSDLSQILLSPSSRIEPTEPVPYMPRPVPTKPELFRESLGLAVSRTFNLMRDVMSSAQVLDPRSRLTLESDSKETPPTDIRSRLRSAQSMMKYFITNVSATPLNGELGPHRRIEWLTMPLDDVKELGRVLDCTINDVVLTTVTEAVRRYLFRRRVDPRHLDFRIAAPVSTRRPEDEKRHGNHVSSWVVPLPIDCEDPLEQLKFIRQQTGELKRSEASLAMDMVMKFAEFIPAPLLATGLGALQSTGAVNMIVTNVPGPQFPLYMVGAKLHAMYPIVPLMPGSGLGVALFSYDGKLCWGFNSDDELVPDLSAFVDDVRVAFERLRHIAVTRFMDQRTSDPEKPPVELTPLGSDHVQKKSARKARKRRQGQCGDRMTGRTV